MLSVSVDCEVPGVILCRHFCVDELATGVTLTFCCILRIIFLKKKVSKALDFKSMRVLILIVDDIFFVRRTQWKWAN